MKQGSTIGFQVTNTLSSRVRMAHHATTTVIDVGSYISILSDALYAVLMIQLLLDTIQHWICMIMRMQLYQSSKVLYTATLTCTNVISRAHVFI